MSQPDYKRIEELYATLSLIENSGDDVLSDVKKEINNEELLLLKDEIMPYLAKYITSLLQRLKCQMDVSIQYDGGGNLSYSFCKSGSSALIRGDVKSEDLADFKIIDNYKEKTITTEKPRSKTEILRVEYPNGRIVQHPKVTDTYVEVIENNYPDLIHELNIVHANVNIVSREYSDQYASTQREISDGWLVLTNTSTRKKREDLIKISEELDLGLKVDIVSIATGEIIEIDDNQSESGRQKIKVSFPDGRVIQPNRVLETVVEVVRYAGPGSVRNLNIMVCGDNLVLKHPKPRYIKACKPVGDEWFVNTCTTTFIKYEQIMFISEQLNLGITAEIVSGYNRMDYHDDNVHASPQLVQNAVMEYTPSQKMELINNSNQQNEFLKELIAQLSQMRTMNNNGIKSPHKAIYVMTLMKGIRDGRINHNKICLEDYLIRTFKDLWVRYVPTNTPFAMEIGNPFMHLSSEPFYFLHLTTEIPNFNIGWTVSAINRVCDHAYVSNEFKLAVISDENSRIIIEHLVNLFGLNGSIINTECGCNPINPHSNGAGYVPKLPKPKIPNQYGAAKFRLTYPSGVREESDSYLDVYVKFIKYANPKRVRELGIFSLGTNIIARQEEINTKYQKQYKDVGSGYYFNTISTTQRKYEVMNYISSQLNLNVKVELIAKNQMF